MFGCVILFLCELVDVCVCKLLSAFVCTASVRQPVMFERQKLSKLAIFNVRLCDIVFFVSLFMRGSDVAHCFLVATFTSKCLLTGVQETVKSFE